jgi:outer membrane protein assembly factor BamB
MKTKTLYALVIFAIGLMWGCSGNNVRRNAESSLVKLGKPNFEGEYEKNDKGGNVSLKLLSKVPNEIIDDDEWLLRYAHGMEQRVNYAFTPGGNRASQELRDLVPLTCGGLYRRSVDVMGEYNVIYYGPRCEYDDFGIDPTLIVVTDESIKEVLYTFDFSQFSVSHYASGDFASCAQISVYGVVIDDNTLYACVSHPTYSNTTAGYNAYLVAIDLKTSTYKWISRPLTCNSSFCIYKDVIFTGYGFTAEPDYIYVLDKETGNRIYSYKLDKAPGYFSVIDDKLHVRTYSFDYSFQIVD